MSGRLANLAKSDWKRFSSSGGFEEDISFTTPDDVLSVNFKGLATKHHLSIDSDGNSVNSKNVHVSVSESFFVEASYPLRNANQEVSLINHKVSFPDSSGVVKNYVVAQCFPDETAGMIVCILSDFE